MPTPRRGETRQQMNERLRKPKPQALPEFIDFARGRWSESTRHNYKMWWDAFVAWGKAENKVLSLPTSAADLTAYVQFRSGDLTVSSLSQLKSAIIGVNDLLGHDVKLKGTEWPDAWAQIRRDKGTRQTPKAPLMGDELLKIIPQMESLRDRAVLLVGFALASRRSELVALDVDDLEFSKDGLRVVIRKSKTDQEGKGTVKRIPRTHGDVCPVAALEAYMSAKKIAEGPVFRSEYGLRLGADVVAKIVKKAAKLAGKDPRVHSGHSLRRGFVTTAFERGAPAESIRDRTGHASMDMLLKYREAAAIFNSPADVAVWGMG